MTGMRITAIVPTYNRSDLLEETLDSLLEQTSAFSTIVVVDDGSTDDTPAVLARYAEKPCVRIIRTENQGVQAARNTGAKAADTDWVAFCDSDDLLDPDYVSTLSELACRHPDVDVVYVNFLRFCEEEHKEEWFTENALETAPRDFFEGADYSDGLYRNIPDLFARLLRFQPFFPSGMCARREAYRRIGGYDPRFRGNSSEDFDFTLRAACSLRVAFYEKPLARVRRHPGNVSNYTARQTLGSAEILEHLAASRPETEVWAEKMGKTIQNRRRAALNGAYERGDFELCKAAISGLRFSSRGLKEHVKAAVTAMPGPVRAACWRMTRKMSGGI